MAQREHSPARIPNVPVKEVPPFKTRLKLMRVVEGISVEVAAARCGINTDTWKSWEADRGYPQQLEMVARQIEAGLGFDHVWVATGFDRSNAYYTLGEGGEWQLDLTDDRIAEIEAG